MNPSQGSSVALVARCHDQKSFHHPSPQGLQQSEGDDPSIYGCDPGRSWQARGFKSALVHLPEGLNGQS